MEPILTEEEATLVMSILIDNLIDLKNSPTGFDDYGSTKDLENSVNKLDNWFKEYGYASE